MTLPATNPNVTTTPTAPATPSAAQVQATMKPRGGDRAAALKAKLESEGPSGDVGEGSEPTERVVAGAPEAPDASEPAVGAQDDAAKRAADRLARIQKVREADRAAKAERQRREAARARDAERSGEVEGLRKKLQELEPLSSVFSSEETLLAEAERRGMTAEKLVSWMRTRLTDPAAVAQQHAKTEADKIREELAAERKAREELQARLEAEKMTAQEQREAQERAQAFIQRTEASEKDYPLSARLLKRHGKHGLVNFASKFIVPLLPEDYTVDQLHDLTEQFLDEVQLAAGPDAPGAVQSAAAANTRKNVAGKATSTLSNAVASERTAVVEEVPLHKLPRDERIKRLRANLDRE